MVKSGGDDALECEDAEEEEDEVEILTWWDYRLQTCQVSRAAPLMIDAAGERR
jgi:hypothetical protein